MFPSICNIFLLFQIWKKMNDYEQFYDDLKFKPPPFHWGRYHPDDPYFHRDNYHDNHYNRLDREHFETERAREIYDREWSLYSQDREQGLYLHNRERGLYLNDMERARDYNEHERRRSMPYNINRQHLFEPDSGRTHFPRGRGNFKQRGRRALSSYGGNNIRGRGVDHRRGQPAVRMYGNFVKAADSSATNDDSKKDTTNESDKNISNPGDTLRFDYKGIQNQRSETEKEVEEALKAYSQQLGFGYGYGPRTDLAEGANWIKQEGQSVGQLTSGSDSSVVNPAQKVESPAVKIEPKTPPEKKPVVTKTIRPEYNFVKAKSEFRSTDVAFHESVKEVIAPKQNHLSVNMGNKRIGLGFGASVNVPAVHTEVAEKVYPGVKDGCNIELDRKFANLHQAVKARNNPNKNDIEILHMAVTMMKMGITNDIKAHGRVQNKIYPQRFICKLFIEGIFVADGLATKKKAAKHDAYTNGVKLLLKESLTVKEISHGVFELKSKEPEFKVPISPSMKAGPGKTVSCDQPPQQQVLSKQQQLAASSQPETSANTSSITLAKPKLVFHKATHKFQELKTPAAHPERVMFSCTNSGKNADPGKNAERTVKSQSRTFQTPCTNPAGLAVKLLNFVKEGESTSDRNQIVTTERNMAAKTPSDNVSISQQSFAKGSKLCSPLPSRKRPAVSDGRDVSRLKVKKVGNSGNNVLNDLSQFVIVDSSVCMDQTQNDLTILHNSANFNRVVLKVEYETSEQGVNCSFVISDEVVATALGMTKDEAKLNAAKEALEVLRDMCFTIKVKQNVDSDSSGLTKEQLMCKIQKGGEMISDSNIGNMLLKKMGWVGGGVGKKGQGIAEPVKAEMVIGREGLGLKASKGIGQDFNRKVTKLLEDYLKSDDQKDLHFASDLLKEERAVIHSLGQRMGLKTNSKGQGDNRYLIISRKRSVHELLEHVMESGGVTSKYEVVPPRNERMDFRKKDDNIEYGQRKQ